MNKSNIHFIKEAIRTKKAREILINVYINENTELADEIIRHWELCRFKNKYIYKKRFYDDNSYNKKKIRNEEIIFIQKIIILDPLVSYFTKQLRTYKLLYDCDDYINTHTLIDDSFYLDSLLNEIEFLYPINPITAKKDSKIRIDLNNSLYEVKALRELAVESYYKDYNDLTNYIVTKYNLKLFKAKYEYSAISQADSSYTQKKVKLEEILFLKKFFQYTEWLEKVDYINFLTSSLSILTLNMTDEHLLFDEKKYLKVFIKKLLKRYHEKLENPHS